MIAPNGEVIPIRGAAQENHVGAAVAATVWQYWTATEDAEFFRDAGAESLLNRARFWASRGEMGEDGLYHIRGVIGPAEYHEDVDDSANTNRVAQWNLERGMEAARLLAERWPDRRRELQPLLDLSEELPGRWTELAGAMYTVSVRRQTSSSSSAAAYEPRVVPMGVLLGRERARRSQIIKQPDVVLLLHLLWDRFPPAVRTMNFRYYEPRCGHGSSPARPSTRSWPHGWAKRLSRSAISARPRNRLAIPVRPRNTGPAAQSSGCAPVAVPASGLTRRNQPGGSRQRYCGADPREE